VSLAEFLVGLAFAAAISAVIGIDAHKNRVPTYGDDYNINTGALAWFIAGVLILIAVLPAYLYRRHKTLKSRQPGGQNIGGRCQSCGHVNQHGANFCNACGKPLQA
jgi:hypothetical protein